MDGVSLAGATVRQDLNDNGVCEPGEVKPLAAWGIVGLRYNCTMQGGVLACPQGVLVISTHTNRSGYLVAEAVALERCSQCGLCFYNCPEPGGITVRRKSKG